MREFPDEFSDENPDDYANDRLNSLELVNKFQSVYKAGERVYFSEDEMIMIANTLINQNQFHLSDVALKYGSWLHPDSLEIPAQKSISNNYRGKYRQTIKLLNKIGLDNIDHMYYFIIAEAYVSINNPKKAKECFEQFLLLCDLDSLYSSFLKIITLYNNYNKPKYALYFISHALLFFPEDHSIYLEKAKASMLIEKYDDAIEYYKFVVDRDSTKYHFLYEVAVAYYNSNRFQEALDTINLKIGIDQDWDGEAYFLQAKCFNHFGRDEEAIEICVVIEDYIFYNQEYITFRANLHRKFGEYKQIECYLSRIAEYYIDTWNDPKYGDRNWNFAVWNELADHYVFQNDYVSAEKLMQTHLELYPTIEAEHRLATYQIELGIKDINMRKSGIKHLLKCIKEMPDNELYNLDAANYYFTQKDFKKAIRYYKKAYKLNPALGEKLFIFMAITYYALEEYDKMQKFYNLATNYTHNAKEIFLLIFPDAEPFL